MLLDNQILNVSSAVYTTWNEGFFQVKARPFSALAYRVSGTAAMVCAGKQYFVEAGDLLYLPQGLSYQVDYSKTEVYVIHFTAAIPDREPEVFSLEDRRKIQRLMHQAAQLWQNKEPGYAQFCTALTYQILGTLCKENMQEQMPPVFLKVLTYIHQNFRRELSVPHLCTHFGISPSALRQYFRRFYHITPTEYIRQLRLEYARNLLAEGASVEKAAMECGVPDAKYFARLVKKTYHCTPRQLHLHGK